MELTIKINDRSKQAKVFYEYLKTLPFVKIESRDNNPYNPEFVKMIKESAASKKRTIIDPEDVWGSLGLM